MTGGDAGVAPDPLGSVAATVAVRRFLASEQDRPGRREVARRIGYQLYVLALVLGFWGTAIVRAYGLRLSAPVATGSASTRLAPALALVVVVLGLRVATWSGPVLLSRPDASWLLPLPLDRRLLLRPHLHLGLIVGGVVGALLGLVLGTELAIAGTGHGLRTVVGTTWGVAALGVVVAAAGLWVETGRRRARAVLVATPPALLLAVGLGWLGRDRVELAVWSGPWGWAVAAGLGDGVGWWLGPVLVTALAVVTVRWARGHLVAVPDEELLRRAGVSDGVRASAALLDARTISRIRTQGQRGLRRVPRVRLPRPRLPWLAVPWQDALTLLRRPWALVRAAILLGVAAAVVARDPSSPLGGVAAAVIGYLPASDLLEGVRAELEDPLPSESLLPFSARTVVWLRLVAPGLLLATAGTVGVVGGALLGALSAAPVGPAIATVWVVTPPLVLAAAIAATRGAPPLQWLIMGDSGIPLIAGWFLIGPVLAVLAAGTPLISLAAGAGLAGAVQTSITAGSFAGAVFIVRLRRRTAALSAPYPKFVPLFSRLPREQGDKLDDELRALRTLPRRTSTS